MNKKQQGDGRCWRSKTYHLGGDMKQAVLMILFLVFFAINYGLTGSGDSDYFIMDTVPPSLTLLSPNGGEAWYIGDTNAIIWTATDTNLDPNSVYLWYSLSGGSQYQNLAEGIYNSGSFPWEMPTVQSYNARVKVQIGDTFGNLSEKHSQGSFTITYVPPAAPEGVVVDTSNGIDAVLSWLPVTSTIYDTPIVPDGYIVLYNETPYEDDQFYYYHGETAGITYTHYNVALRRDQMYYRIVAFKDYDDRMGEVLGRLKKTSGEPRLWRDVLWELHNDGGVR